MLFRMDIDAESTIAVQMITSMNMDDDPRSYIVAEISNTDKILPVDMVLHELELPPITNNTR